MKRLTLGTISIRERRLYSHRLLALNAVLFLSPQCSVHAIPACTWILSRGGTQKHRAIGGRPNGMHPHLWMPEEFSCPFPGLVLLQSGSLELRS